MDVYPGNISGSSGNFIGQQSFAYIISQDCLIVFFLKLVINTFNRDRRDMEFKKKRKNQNSILSF